MTPHLLKLSLLGAAALLAGSTALAQGFDPPLAVDINSDPTIVEINLEASVTTWEYISGVQTTVWAYNGSVPGPTIQANVGDTVIVHFTNNLPEPTTVHWHGVETPAKMDGSHISQLTVQPGATFDYQFEVHRAALNWYHPHVRTFDQVEKGLQGALLVKDPVLEAQLGLDTIEEHIVFFDDILLDASLQVVPAFSFTDPLENALYHVNGREGNYLLVNGREASEVNLDVANGEPQRWRVVNSANTSIGRLDFRNADGGISGKLWELGHDGGFNETPFERLPVAPPTEHPSFALLSEMGQGVVLFPGERMDVVFTPTGADGEELKVWWQDWPRGRHNAFYDVDGVTVLLGDDPLDGLYPQRIFTKMTLQGPDPGLGDYVPPAVLTTIPGMPSAPIGTIPVTFGHGAPDLAGNITLFAQADFSTGTMVPLPAPLVDSQNAADANVGEVWQWEITNLSHGDHPFHAHGFYFLPREFRFTDMDDPINNFSFFPSRKILKDTIRIPKRPGAKGRSTAVVTANVYFDDPNRVGELAANGTEPTIDVNGDYTSGGWLFHCHVLEHSGKGMLSFYELHDAVNNPYSYHGKWTQGTAGKTHLTGRGDPGVAVSFDVVNATPNSTVFLVLGRAAVYSMVRGGTLVPNPNLVIQGTTDANGYVAFDVPQVQFLPSGTTVFAQVAFADVGAPQGWAFSNALSFLRP